MDNKRVGCLYVLLDMSPVDGPKAKEVPLQNKKGNPMCFPSIRSAQKYYNFASPGYFDNANKYVEFKYKIAERPKKKNSVMVQG